MLLFNAEVINFRLKKLDEYIKGRQAVAKQYDEALKEYVTIQYVPDGLNHNYHKYVVRFQNKEVRDRVKERLGLTFQLNFFLVCFQYFFCFLRKVFFPEFIVSNY